jgi:integrase
MKADKFDSAFFKKYLDSKGLRDSTIELYVDTIDLFLSKDPDLELLDSYNYFLKDHAYDKKSYYSYYAIRAFVKYKFKDNITMRGSILKNLLRPKNADVEKNTVYLSPKKREEIIEYMEGEKHRLIAKIQHQTGARVGDVLKLNRGSINYEQYKGRLVMKIVFVGKRGVRVTKYVFDKKLQEEITQFIKDHYLDETYYFLEYDRSFKRSSENVIMRTNYHWYWQDLKQALMKAGVDKRSWASHDFRRCISREIWEDPELGKDLQLLQNFLGHKNPSTTLRYLRNSGLTTRDVSEKLAMRAGKLS